MKRVSPEQISAAITKAQKAYKEWSKKPIEERALVLKSVAKLYRERKDQLAQLMAKEMGKKIEHGLGELQIVAEIFDYYAEEGAQILQPKRLETRDGIGTIVNQSVGIIYGIQP